jgi:NADH:ubiquinone oxidoreductase subunit 3 (subunit A)
MRSAGTGTGEAGHLPALLVLGEIAAFVAVLGFALIYAWRKKVLEWD